MVFDTIGGEVFDESLRGTAWGARVLVVGFASGKHPSIRANYVPRLQQISVSPTMSVPPEYLRLRYLFLPTLRIHDFAVSMTSSRCFPDLCFCSFPEAWGAFPPPFYLF